MVVREANSTENLGRSSGSWTIRCRDTYAKAQIKISRTAVREIDFYANEGVDSASRGRCEVVQSKFHFDCLLCEYRA